MSPAALRVPAGEFADAMKFLEQQTATALDDAGAHGFAPLPVHVVPGAGHGPLVLAWCDSLQRRPQRRRDARPRDEEASVASRSFTRSMARLDLTGTEP